MTELPETSDSRPAERIGPILARWIKRAGLANASDREKLWTAWQDLLGPDAERTCLERLHRGTATFAVDSSALLSELNNFRKRELLDALADRLPSPRVHNLRFRLEKRGPLTGTAS